MGFNDVASMPSQSSFSTTVPKSCDRSESLRITTCSKTVVAGKQGHAPCILLLLQQCFLRISQISWKK